METINHDLIVVPGVYKSGTTTLHKILTQHRSIGALENENRSIKEPNFFAIEEEKVRENIEWYKSLFSREKNKHVDASVSYLISDKSLDLIERYFENVKYIILIRDPIERLHSSYLHMNARVKNPEKRSINNIVKRIYKKDESVVEAENEEIKRACKKGLVCKSEHDDKFLMRRCSAPFKASFQDPFWDYKYIQHSLYSKWVRRYKNDSDNVLVESLENIVSEPNIVLKKIFDFIGVRSMREFEVPHKNRTKSTTLLGDMYFRISRMIRKCECVEEFFRSDWLEPIKKLSRPLLYTNRQSEKSLDDKTLNRLESILKKEYLYWKKRRPDIYENWKTIRKIKDAM